MNAKTSHDSFRSRHVVEKNKRAMIFVAIYFVYFISPVLFPQIPPRLRINLSVLSSNDLSRGLVDRITKYVLYLFEFEIEENTSSQEVCEIICLTAD